MRRIETRSSKSFEYLELSSPKRRGRARLRTPPSERNQSTPPRTTERPFLPTERRRKCLNSKVRRHSASPSFRTGSLSLFPSSFKAVQGSTQSVHTVGTVQNQQGLVPPPVMVRQFAFVPFNQGSPLNLVQHDNIPLAVLKNLLEYTGEGKTTALEHIRDVATLCYAHHITQDNVAVRLLATSLRGKALQWFRGLNVGSIATWDDLGEALSKYFEDKSDYLSLVEQLTTIKRAPQEQMTDFNMRFQKTWDRIPIQVRPSAEHAFLYYLKSLNSDISVLIQSMGGISLPQSYGLAVRSKNCLIQAGKIAPRPPMPIFPDIQSNIPLIMPPFATLPTTPALQIAAANDSNTAGSFQELQDIKSSQQKMENILQTIGNELVSIKKQQYQGRSPFQQ
jgi:hypothetical protein